MTPLLIDAGVALASMAMGPAFDFIKKKFVPASNDTPERTMGTLATTNPEVLPAFASAQAGLIEAKVKWFRRDVLGQTSQWVTDLRAAIRPITVIVCLAIMFADGFALLTVDNSVRLFCISNVSNWMGARLVK